MQKAEQDGNDDMSEPAACAHTVLIADDDALLRRALRRRLAMLGYSAVECADGLAAIAKCRDQRFDAIILDHDMPLGEGMAIVGNIRQYSDTPVVFLSGHPQREFAEVVRRVPETYYLPKPLDSERLKQLLQALIAPIA